MRELNRFRSDFNECYSLRSKLKKTQKVCTDIGKFITVNADLLTEEKKTLIDFSQEKDAIKKSSTNISMRVLEQNEKLNKDK